jgi:hypothetical protein
MAHLGAAALDLLTDKDKLAMLVAGGSALALGVYGARWGAFVRAPRACVRSCEGVCCVYDMCDVELCGKA